MMPILIVLSIIIAIYSVTRPGALAGVKYFLVPNFQELLMDDRCCCNGTDVLFLINRHGDLNYIWFIHEKEMLSIEDSTRNVEIFDTAIAIMAGLMIIPAVFAFSGGDPDALQCRSFINVHHYS